MAIEISTPAEFMAIKDWTDRGTADEPLDIVITADLDFSEIDNFGGLGTSLLYANIDGQGHAIKNIVTNYTSSDAFHFLGRSNNIGTVANIIIDNCHIACGQSDFRIESGSAYIHDIKINNNCYFQCYGYMCMFENISLAENIGISGTYISTFRNIVPFGSVTNIINSFVTANLTAFNTVYGFCNGYSKPYNCFARNIISAKTVFGFKLDPSTSSPSPYAALFCYAANIINDATEFYGFDVRQGSKGYAFFDNTLVNNAPDNDTYGQPTENLKSAEWLRSQGWAI